MFLKYIGKIDCTLAVDSPENSLNQHIKREKKGSFDCHSITYYHPSNAYLAFVKKKKKKLFSFIDGAEYFTQALE